MSRDVYDYWEADGSYSFTVVVERGADGVKKAWQGLRVDDGSGSIVPGLNGLPEPPLYRLLELNEHLAAGRRDPIYVVEGEKDVEAVRALGHTATTNPMGAGKWKPWHTDSFIGARCAAVVADADDPGRAHARAVHRELCRVVGSSDVELMTTPADLGDHADVSDLLAVGRSLDEHVELGAEAEPESAPRPGPEPWLPVPLTEAAGSAPEVEAIFGRGLVYGTGTSTLLSGEPGVGKSMFLTATIADAVLAGDVTLYLDFERTADLLLSRLEAAGLGHEIIASRVFYLRPTEPDSAAGIEAMVERLRPALAVVDSYDAALALFGLETKNEDVRAFGRLVVDPLRSAGACCLLADHVPKDREKRGRYSIGGQAKLGLADAHLGLSVITPLRRGAEGKLKVKAHKDNYGLLPLAAVFTLHSHELTGALTWNVRIEDVDAGDGNEPTFRPTRLMERVSRLLEIAGRAVSRADVERDVKGKRDYIRQAIDALVREGFAEEESGARGARLVKLVRPYREADDEEADE